MDAQTGPGSGQSLVIEVGARTAVINGEKIELPPAEFDLLHALSLHPGEVVPKEKLLQQVWPDSPVMTSDDLHWRIWSLRKVIGDHRRTDKIVGNRRGVGYFIDLPVDAVRVTPVRSAPSTDEDPGTNVIVLEPRAGERELEDAVAEVEPDSSDEADAPQQPLHMSRSPLHPVVAVAAVAIVLGMLGGSWLTGYWASQRNVAGAPTSPPSLASSPEAAGRPAKDNRAKDVKVTKEKRGGPTKSSGAEPAGRKYRARNSGAGSVGQTASGPVVASEPEGQAARPRPKPAAREEAPPPAPPQPDAHLYHLFNPDSGDHYVTTSSAAANQKQAAGYSASTEGRVFTSQVSGTVRIALDSGSAYIYSDKSSAPGGVSVAQLFRLQKNGDFFYTTSSSKANQAEAQGWARTSAGYVAT